MVNLTKIYTRIGDGGQTNLVDMSFTAKTDARVQAYGDTDEANSVIGVALATGGLPERVETMLRHIQNELFDVGADLANPVVTNPTWEPLRIIPECIDRLEAWCDELSEDLPRLRSFILPGGTPAGSYLHLARTIVRRAERSAWAAVEAHGTDEGDEERPGGVNPLAVKYLNRLSDLLFIMSRVANGTDGEILWVPGGERNPAGAPKGDTR